MGKKAELKTVPQFLRGLYLSDDKQRMSERYVAMWQDLHVFFIVVVSAASATCIISSLECTCIYKIAFVHSSTGG